MPLRLLRNSLSDLVELIRKRSANSTRPYIISIDGRSGVGKSTYAKKLASLLDASVIEGDDFYYGGIEIRSDSPKERASNCIDLKQINDVLMQLRRNEVAMYRAFDWDSFNGTLSPLTTVVESGSLFLIEGVYTGSPVLGDCLDLRILLRTSDEERTRHLTEREGALGPWELQWHEAEQYYFNNVATSDIFDVIIDDDGIARANSLISPNAEPSIRY